MAEVQKNFGDTLSGGIQDIAALLPLLGTDQCERHVGEALQKGYLYAAATPLSVFGSLGIVKASFATFLAITNRPVHGGSWLQDAGIGTTGSVASMVILAPGTKRYGAEVQLERLMKEQHITNPEMISSVKWFGWRRAGDSSLSRRYLSWNLCLVLTSAVASLFAITPYIYLALHTRGNVTLAWLFPSLRSFGSFICVVSVQLALQLRIHSIASSSLLLMKARHRDPPSPEKSKQDQDKLLEIRLMEEKKAASDPEKAEKGQQKHEEDFTTPLSVEITMVVLQASLMVGMGMIVAGYVGSLNLVNQTRAKNGPYFWFGAEALLSIARVMVWGFNPSWDERNTGIVLQLDLRPKMSIFPLQHPGTDEFGFSLDIDPSAATLTKDAVQIFPIITSALHLNRLNEAPSVYYMGEDLEWRTSFVAHSLEDFLSAASTYAGPLDRFTIDGFSVYYAVLAEVSHNKTQKLLCTTVVPHGAGWNSVSLLVSGGDEENWDRAFLSRTRHPAGTHILEVAFYKQLDHASGIDLEPKTTKAITRAFQYSNTLFRQLFAQKPTSRLHLSWSLAFSPPKSSIPDENLVSTVSPLDEEYMKIGQRSDLKGDHCLDRENQYMDEMIVRHITVPHDPLSLGLFTEYAQMLDSAIQETYLCIMEQRFVRRCSLANNLSRCLALQWIQKMETRLSVEKSIAIFRIRRWLPHDAIIRQFSTTWDSLSAELRSLRLLPTNSPVVQSWEGYLFDLLNHGSLPDISKLFLLQPFTSPHIQKDIQEYLSPLLTHDNNYHTLVRFIRSSIDYLRTVKQPPSFARMDPRGPGSPHFSPPYTFLNSPVVDDTARAFRDRIHEIEILILWNGTPVQGAYEILSSDLPASPPLLLTTLIHHNLRVQPEETLELCSLLKKRRNIIFHLYDRCEDFSGVKARIEVDRAIALNRQIWREDASQLRGLCYQFGLELTSDSDVADLDHSRVRRIGNDSLLLQRDVCVAAVIHLPVHARIIPILSARNRIGPGEVDFAVRLVRFLTAASDHGEEVFGVGKLPFELQGSNMDVKFDTFPLVPPGCYEMFISANSPYIFTGLVIDSAPRCAEIHHIHPTDVVEETETLQGAAAPSCHSQSSRDSVSGEHEDLLDVGPSNSVPSPHNSEPSETQSIIIHPSAAPPFYQFQFSLRGPEGGYHHGSFTFSLENTQDFTLNSLTLLLWPFTQRLPLVRYRAHPNSYRNSSVPEEGTDQTHADIDWTDVHGDVEFVAQDSESGGAPEAAVRDTGSSELPPVEIIHVPSDNFDRSDPGHSKMGGEISAAFGHQPAPSHVYQFQFSLDSAEGFQQGSFIFFPEIAQYSKLEYFTMELSLHTSTLQLDRYWLDPNSNPSASETEGEMGEIRVDSSCIVGLSNDSEQGDQPQGSGVPEAWESSDEEEGDNHAPLTPSSKESECHSDHHSTNCRCLVLRRNPLDHLPFNNGEDST